MVVLMTAAGCIFLMALRLAELPHALYSAAVFASCYPYRSTSIAIHSPKAASYTGRSRFLDQWLVAICIFTAMLLVNAGECQLPLS